MTTDHSSDKTFYNVSYVLLFFDCYITSKVIDVLDIQYCSGLIVHANRYLLRSHTCNVMIEPPRAVT